MATAAETLPIGRRIRITTFAASLAGSIVDVGTVTGRHPAGGYIVSIWNKAGAGPDWSRVHVMPDDVLAWLPPRS